MSILLMILAFLTHIASRLIHKSEKKVSVLMLPSLTPEEIEEARKYATLFGLSNDTHNLNIYELLEKGRKYKEYLGSEKIEEIHAIIQNTVSKYNQDLESRGIHHQINRLIDIHALVAAVLAPAYIKLTELGGDRSDEPGTNRH